jgi:O-antigen/teichoic acid export membrane protein
MICLSVIPQPFYWAGGMLLNSINKTQLYFYFDLIFTFIFTAAVLFALNWNIYGVAVSVLISHFVILPFLTMWSVRQVFGKQ